MNIVKVYSVPYHFFDSSYFNVEGIDRRAELMFLKVPPLTLHSICRDLVNQLQKKRTLPLSRRKPRGREKKGSRNSEVQEKGSKQKESMT